MTNKIIVPNVILLSEVERMLKEGKQVTLRARVIACCHLSEMDETALC